MLFQCVCSYKNCMAPKINLKFLLSHSKKNGRQSSAWIHNWTQKCILSTNPKYKFVETVKVEKCYIYYMVWGLRLVTWIYLKFPNFVSPVNTFETILYALFLGRVEQILSIRSFWEKCASSDNQNIFVSCLNSLVTHFMCVYN